MEPVYGLLTQLQRDRDWLVTVHCISHLLELALKDCLLKEKSFKDMNDLMIILYYQFRRSGKLKRQVKELAKVNAFPKVYGTCFINHVRKELTNLLNNWGAADKVVSMMPSMIESVKKCIQTRSKLDETMEEVFRAMTWLDPANWCDTDEEVRMMNLVYERFKVPPHKAGFSVASLKTYMQSWVRIF
ncbi:hypothetical protein CAPTEDRAFT_206917 [Capitella teleta]|uniref:Uncharacterized protein n=1 Tax=Capitella teleta TaxID=283909 RepID=R7UU62_CAPTE|nr:hypothetical protein CAPTEDRAFT_206917 [Capitella teleta]|eukprot:ELU09725.1 hypothetical protein CAPTEDRAFT_206917 [Capitella teleta]